MLRRQPLLLFAAAGTGGAARASQAAPEVTAVPKFDPKKFGLTDDDVFAKAREAAKPYKFKSGKTNKSFDVTSTTQAQAKLTGALRESASQSADPAVRQALENPIQAQKDALAASKKKKDRRFYEHLAGALVFGGIAIFVVVGTWLAPSYHVHSERQQRRQRRYEEVFLPSMDRLLEAQANGGPPPGEATEKSFNGWEKFGQPKPPPRSKPSCF